MAAGAGDVVEFALPQPVAAPSGAVLGWVVRSDEAGLWVDHPGNNGEPQLAVSVVALDATTLAAAIEARTDAVLLFTTGDAPTPIVLGFKQETPVTEGDWVVGEDAVAKVDGKRVVLEGRDEVVLRCGKASIVLRRNGRVVIRGVQVESRASGRNRIKGGAVLIN